MGAMKTLMWVIIAVTIAVFSMANWNPVTVTIWPDWRWDTQLPVLIVLAFLSGALPMWVMLRAARWSLTRRLDNSERQLADMRAMANRPPEPAVTEAAAPEPTALAGLTP